MRLRELNLSPATAPSAIGMPEAGGGHFACAVHVYYLAPVKSLDTCAPLHRSARLSQRLASELNVNAVNVEGSLFRSPWPLRLVACICTEKLIQGSPATPFISRWANEGRPVHRGGSQLQVRAPTCGSAARTSPPCSTLFSLTDVVLAGARRQPRFTPTTLSLASSWTPTSGAHCRPGRSTWNHLE
jgi:hypothetical protein